MNREVRRERHVGELETALVVALAGRAVRHRVGFLLPRDLDLRLRDQRPRDRGAKIILPFVDRVRPDHRVDEVPREFLDQVECIVLRRSRLAGLLGQPFQLLLLANIGGECDDLRVIGFAQPFNDDRRVQSAGVSQYDFHSSRECEVIGDFPAKKFQRARGRTQVRRRCDDDSRFLCRVQILHRNRRAETAAASRCWKS